jgi:hypothetical protein
MVAYAFNRPPSFAAYTLTSVIFIVRNLFHLL